MTPAVRSTQRRQIEANVRTSLGEVALVSELWDRTVDVISVSPLHHVQLSLGTGPLPASGRFSDRWPSQRFRPVGRLFLFPAHETIHARSEVRQQRSVVCQVRPQAMAQWFETDFAWTDRCLEGSLDITSETVRRILLRLRDELREPGFAGQEIVELLIAQLGLELSRYLHAADAQAARYEPGGLAPWRLDLIDQCLCADAGRATLAGLAALCGLSVRHLARGFRASRGRSLGEQIAADRIAQARRLLDGGMSIKQTAHATGFSAPTNFSHAFRKATGQTPRGYRKASAGRGAHA